jgi:glycosyltransferase involved in cell wall biosynthesis
VLIDYRPALRERSGVGEYVFQLARALLAVFPREGGARTLDLTLLSSSWKDRVERDAALKQATVVDRRVPVSVLNLLWHRLEWPAAETMTGRAFDVAHSPHPLLLPSRAAARVVTIHDLYFLSHPERSRAEVRRDYPALVRSHAQRADRIIVPSRFTANDVQRRLQVPAERISVCPHGRPAWTPRTSAPADGYVLFLGTLEPRKNVSGLLDAFERLIANGRGGAGHHQGRPVVPRLVLAGHAPDDARPWLERIDRPPLQGHVSYTGYVDPARRRELYEGARLLVQPSFEEGFGFPVLEAMTIGVPVVAANRGALPELLGDAGLLVDPEDPDQMASAIGRLLNDETLAADCVARGLLRARRFDWMHTAQLVYEAYHLAIGRHQCASA